VQVRTVAGEEFSIVRIIALGLFLGKLDHHDYIRIADSMSWALMAASPAWRISTILAT
jgi:hypothetical protein